jgi:membrane protein
VYIDYKISDNIGFLVILKKLSMNKLSFFLEKIWNYCRRLGRVGPLFLKLLWLCGKAFRDLWMDGGFTQAAAISFYFVLSIFPMLLLLIGVAGFFLKPEYIQDEVLGWLSQYFPTGTRMVFKDNIEAIIEARRSTTLLGSIVLLWSCTLMFDAINQAVNAAWGMRGNSRFLMDKFKSLLLIFVIVVSALFSTFLSTRMTSIARFEIRLEEFSNLGREAIALAGMLIPVFLSVGAFGLAYRLLPRVRISIRDVWPAAILSAFLWELSKKGFVWYLNEYTEYKQIYGSISAVFILMLWAYFSSLILAWGAELTSEIWKERRKIALGSKRDYPFLGAI